MPATREIIELSLMEEFHWTPEDIAKIPYKTIQKIFLIKQHKNSIENENLQKAKFRSQNSGKGPRRFTREV